jgi:glycine oxidase
VSTPDVLVVGGGVVGASVAYHAAVAGAKVALLERDCLAAHASSAAAGMLLPLGEARTKGPFLSFGLRSLTRFPALVEKLREHTGIDPEYEASGALHLAHSADQAQRLCDKARDLGVPELVWLDAAALRARAPYLARDLHGALWSPREAHVQSGRLALAFARAASALGARIETGVEVTGLLQQAGCVRGVETLRGLRRAGAVVLCTGAWSARCAGWLPGAWPLPVEPAAGQVLALERPASGLREILAAGPTYLVPKRDARLLVGATQDRVGFDHRVTAAGLAQLLAGALALLPSLATCAFHGAWSGLRPATPDGLPIVGPLPGVSGLFVATGHFRNGILLAPITGELIADLLAGREPPDDARAFYPARFASRGQPAA